MFRMISASADNYITSKIIENSRSLDSNVGQAGTLDLFVLVDETNFTQESGSIIELSRGLIKFDYSNIPINKISSPTFTASIVLKNVYGGQTVPSNYSLVLYPLSKAFDEGRGFDVASYKDLDTSNFLKCSSNTFWTLSGANASGSLGENVDIIVSGNLGSGNVDLGSVCTFNRGDEDGVFNVTRIVSASVAGILQNNGFRLSFIPSQEQDLKTRFVKRFGTKQSLNKNIRPKLIVEYDDRIIDNSGNAYLNTSQSFFIYNYVNGNPANFISNSISLVGTNSITLQLIASKSISYLTNSYQANFLQTITHKTSSMLYYSRSFSASQFNNETGVYSSSFILDTTTDSELRNFVSNSNIVGFNAFWKSNDNSINFGRKFIKFKAIEGDYQNINISNYVINVVNLKREYQTFQETRLKVFIQDRTLPIIVSRAAELPKSVIFSDMRWQLKKAYTGDLVIPFSTSTRMSSDSESMYFDLFIQDLDENEIYELEFLIKNEQGKDILIDNKGFTFKVIK